MAKCDVCGNDYDKSFQVVRGSERRTFDSFAQRLPRLLPAGVVPVIIDNRQVHIDPSSIR